LNKAQRCLSKREKGGKNRAKQRVKVARLHRKVRNVRKDLLHQTTSRMIIKYDGFVVETLNIEGMMKNHCLAKSIADVGWYDFKQKLKYKAEWLNKGFWEIGTFEPSSKCCHRCGWKDTDQTLKDRTFCCEQCGLEMDRDLNAAKNILQIGKRQILSDGQEFTLGDEKRLQPVEGSASRRAKKKQCVVLIG
jgi:putative transposase